MPVISYNLRKVQLTDSKFKNVNFGPTNTTISGTTRILLKKELRQFMSTEPLFLAKIRKKVTNGKKMVLHTDGQRVKSIVPFMRTLSQKMCDRTFHLRS